MPATTLGSLAVVSCHYILHLQKEKQNKTKLLKANKILVLSNVKCQSLGTYLFNNLVSKWEVHKKNLPHIQTVFRKKENKNTYVIVSVAS